MSFAALPSNLILQIASYLPVSTYIALASVSASLRTLLRSDISYLHNSSLQSRLFFPLENDRFRSYLFGYSLTLHAHIFTIQYHDLEIYESWIIHIGNDGKCRVWRRNQPKSGQNTCSIALETTKLIKVSNDHRSTCTLCSELHVDGWTTILDKRYQVYFPTWKDVMDQHIFWPDTRSSQQMQLILFHGPDYEQAVDLYRNEAFVSHRTTHELLKWFGITAFALPAALQEMIDTKDGTNRIWIEEKSWRRKGPKGRIAAPVPVIHPGQIYNPWA